MEELLFLKEWNWTIIDFLKQKNRNSLSADMYYHVINDTFSKANLRGMRMVYRDINEMALGFSLVDLDELNHILRKKFDTDLVKEKNLTQIKKIEKRGHLKSDDEFRMLSSRVEEIYADDSKQNEVEILNKLMGDYEESKRIKLLKNHAKEEM